MISSFFQRFLSVNPTWSPILTAETEKVQISRISTNFLLTWKTLSGWLHDSNSQNSRKILNFEINYNNYSAPIMPHFSRSFWGQLGKKEPALIWYDVKWYYIIWPDTTRRSTVWYDTIRCDQIRYDNCDCAPGPGSCCEEDCVWRCGSSAAQPADASSGTWCLSLPAGHGGEHAVCIHGGVFMCAFTHKYSHCASVCRV